MSTWYFKFYVREGQPGCADDDTYTSNVYDSFEKCFRDYIKFNPNKQWRYLRNLSREEFIYANNGIEHINKASDGLIYYDNSELELGISDQLFDKIINDIQNS